MSKGTFGMPDARLLMIVPTRGRPRNAAELWQAWKDTTGPEADVLFAVDDDDPELETYKALGVPLRVRARSRFGGILNQVALEVAAPWGYFATGYMGDDHRPRSSGWSRRFLEELDRLGTGMVYGNDLLQGQNLPTAIAMTTDIIWALGYMVPGGLEHLFVDNAHLELGRAIGRIKYLPDVVLEHMHPVAGKAVEDDLYRLNNAEAQYEADGRRFEDWKRFNMAADVAKLQHMIAMKAAVR